MSLLDHIHDGEAKLEAFLKHIYEEVFGIVSNPPSGLTTEQLAQHLGDHVAAKTGDFLITGNVPAKADPAQLNLLQEPASPQVDAPTGTTGTDSDSAPASASTQNVVGLDTDATEGKTLYAQTSVTEM